MKPKFEPKQFGDFTIREVEKDDMGAMARLYKESFPEHILVHLGDLTNTDTLQQQASSDNKMWVVGEKEGDIIAAAALEWAPILDGGEVERVVVDKNHRGNGYSTEICGTLVDYAQQQLNLGYVEAFARGTQPGMQKTFVNLGFTAKGISERFVVIYNEQPLRESFVHLSKVLKPETVHTQVNLHPEIKKQLRNLGNLY